MSKTKKLSGAEVLAIPMQDNGAGADTIKNYLIALLSELWDRGERFSGKRPFGDSGWEHELYRALVTAKVVPGALDEDGYLADYDESYANELIFAAIDAL